MRRFIFLMSMLTACVGYTIANEIVVSDVVIPKGGTATLDIQLNNEQVLSPVFEFYLRLPEGITVVDRSEKLGNRFDESKVSVSCEPNDTRYWIMAMINQPFAQNDGPIPGEDGTIVTLELQANDDLDEGTVVLGTIEDPSFITWFADKNGDPVTIPSPVDFQISIGAPADTRTTFDENSDNGDVLKAATGVDVRVKRTIKADQWSTICLPFAMTSEQVVSAFGSEVELGDFNGIETTYEDENETIVSGIKVKFNTVTAIEANHPYIIRVGTPVSTFTVDNVDIIVEETPSVDKDEYSYQVQVGKNKYETRYMYNSFVGTYVAETEIPEKCLFLSDNQFWYSTGQTKSKGFRAYFDFYEWLPEAELSSSRVQMVFDESETTGISGVAHETSDDRYYNLSGQRVEHVKKGLYIKNNKKVVVK